MLNNIMIGQYFPGDSFLHRMDARVKILLLLILLIEVFVFTSAPVYLLMTGIVIECLHLLHFVCRHLGIDRIIHGITI